MAYPAGVSNSNNIFPVFVHFCTEFLVLFNKNRKCHAEAKLLQTPLARAASVAILSSARLGLAWPAQLPKRGLFKFHEKEFPYKDIIFIISSLLLQLNWGKTPEFLITMLFCYKTSIFVIFDVKYIFPKKLFHIRRCRCRLRGVCMCT